MTAIQQEALDKIFLKARTHSTWLEQPVEDDLLRKIYDILKMGPTSTNCCPARFIFVKTKGEKQKLADCASSGNKEKILKASITLIIAHDMEFYEKLPKLAPHVDARSWFANNPKLIESTAFRNSSLQGAYFIIAARALGLDCGPMSGFDNDKLDQVFLYGTKWKSNFICSFGFGDSSKVHDRAPRLDFDEACKII